MQQRISHEEYSGAPYAAQHRHLGKLLGTHCPPVEDQPSCSWHTLYCTGSGQGGSALPGQHGNQSCTSALPAKKCCRQGTLVHNTAQTGLMQLADAEQPATGPTAPFSDSQHSYKMPLPAGTGANFQDRKPHPAGARADVVTVLAVSRPSTTLTRLLSSRAGPHHSALQTAADTFY